MTADTIASGIAARQVERSNSGSADEGIKVT